MNRIWPRLLMAEIKLKLNRDPVALTIGVLPLGPQVVPVW
jgi:hypothetical protein